MTSKLASLHAGLVARKGEAMPALTNPLFSYVDTPRPAAIPSARLRQPAPSPEYGNEGAAERRVWPQVARQAAANEVVRPTPAREIEPAMVAKPPEVKFSPPKPEHESVDSDHLHRHRFTFRMTQSQRRRLRLAAAVQDQSLQQLLSAALDNHLEGLCACSLKSCACLAAAEAQGS